MSRALLSCCLVVTGLVGCGDDDGIEPTPDGGVEDGGRRVDGGPPAMPMTLTYMPEGCAYEVRTPEVTDVGRMGTALGASPAPVQVHASFAGPTDTSFAVTWRTDEETTYSQIVFGTDQAMVEAADAASGDVRVAEGHHLLFDSVSGESLRLHEVHVCGLEASTRYYYKVGGPGGWSGVFDVATGPTIGATEAFRFAVSGDSRNDAMTWAEVQRAIQTEMPDFQIFSGDAVVLGVNQPDWDDYFGQMLSDGFSVEDSLARIPLMPTNGNHEGLAVNYVIQWALPQQESPMERAEGEEWYAFDYGNAHFVVLNDTANDAIIQAERDFLEADLGAVDRAVTPWVFVMHHKAPYSCSNHGSQVDLRTAWQPLYDTYGVDVVWNGHDHNYERSKPIRGLDGSNEGIVAMAAADGAAVDGSGTMYIVAGGAGAPLYDAGTCYHTHVSESVNHYAIVDIDGRTMRFTAYRLDGTTLDQFEYTKP